MGKYLIVDAWGSFLGVRNGRFVLRARKGKEWVTLADAAPTEIDSIVLQAEGSTVSIAALNLAAEHGVDVVLMPNGDPSARLIPAKYGSVAWKWLKQLKEANNPKRRAELAASIVYGKVRNQAAVIRSYRKSLEASGKKAPHLRRTYEELIQKAEEARKSVDDWREAAQIEAAAAKIYWEAVKTLIPETLGFKTRLKKWSLPPNQKPDPFNAALNIGYAILAKEVWRAIFKVGLNPYIGFLHEKRPGRLSLVYDLMEEFRPPVVDKPLIKLARKNPEALKPLKERDKEKSRKAARNIWKEIIQILRDTHPPYRSIIESQVRKFSSALIGGGFYFCFVLRF